MEAKELRIGNWIKCNDTQMQVTSIMSHSVGIEQGNIIGAIHNNDIDPIPLTEGWLTKLGFSYYDKLDCWCHPNSFLHVEKDISGNFRYRDEEWEIAISTVHYLQNLFFILMDKELEVKQ